LGLPQVREERKLAKSSFQVFGLTELAWPQLGAMPAQTQLERYRPLKVSQFLHTLMNQTRRAKTPDESSP